MNRRTRVYARHEYDALTDTLCEHMPGYVKTDGRHLRGSGGFIFLYIFVRANLARKKGGFSQRYWIRDIDTRRERNMRERYSSIGVY